MEVQPIIFANILDVSLFPVGYHRTLDGLQQSQETELIHNWTGELTNNNSIKPNNTIEHGVLKS